MTKPAFQDIPEAERERVLKLIIDATIESLNLQAEMMEAGQIPMRAGPDALRSFACQINVALINLEAEV